MVFRDDTAHGKSVLMENRRPREVFIPCAREAQDALTRYQLQL